MSSLYPTQIAFAHRNLHYAYITVVVMALTIVCTFVWMLATSSPTENTCARVVTSWPAGSMYPLAVPPVISRLRQ